MRVTVLLLASIPALLAQPLPQGKPIEGIKVDAKSLMEALNPTVHIHTLMHGSCAGQPDHVYGHTDGVYYACIGEQDVCTVAKAHKGVGVPKALITQYEQVKVIQEAEHQEFERAQAERQAQRVRDGRSTGDPALDAAIAKQKSEAIANEVRTARAQGRRPDLARFTNTPGSAATPAPRTAQPTVAAATVKRASTTLLADDKLAGIGTGAALSDVLQQLGNPYSRIAGDSERWTYRLESGRTARLEFEHGVLARVEIQP